MSAKRSALTRQMKILEMLVPLVGEDGLRFKCLVNNLVGKSKFVKAEYNKVYHDLRALERDKLIKRFVIDPEFTEVKGRRIGCNITALGRDMYKRYTRPSLLDPKDDIVITSESKKSKSSDFEECPSFGKFWDPQTRECKYCEEEYENSYKSCKELTVKTQEKERQKELQKDKFIRGVFTATIYPHLRVSLSIPRRLFLGCVKEQEERIFNQLVSASKTFDALKGGE